MERLVIQCVSICNIRFNTSDIVNLYFWICKGKVIADYIHVIISAQINCRWWFGPMIIIRDLTFLARQDSRILYQLGKRCLRQASSSQKRFPPRLIGCLVPLLIPCGKVPAFLRSFSLSSSLETGMEGFIFLVGRWGESESGDALVVVWVGCGGACSWRGCCNCAPSTAFEGPAESARDAALGLFTGSSSSDSDSDSVTDSGSTGWGLVLGSRFTALISIESF